MIQLLKQSSLDHTNGMAVLIIQSGQQYYSHCNSPIWTTPVIQLWQQSSPENTNRRVIKFGELLGWFVCFLEVRPQFANIAEGTGTHRGQEHVFR